MNVQPRKPLSLILGLVLFLLSGTNARAQESVSKPEIVIEVCSELLSSSVANDFLEKNIGEKARIKNCRIQLTDSGILLTGTKVIKLLPNANFKALIDVLPYKDNQIELRIRKARVYGVELKWLSGKMVNYLQKKLASGKAAKFLSLTKNGWVKEEGEKRAYSIIISLKPENMVEMMEKPVVTSMSVSQEALLLGISTIE